MMLSPFFQVRLIGPWAFLGSSSVANAVLKSCLGRTEPSLLSSLSTIDSRRSEPIFVFFQQDFVLCLPRDLQSV